VSEAEFPQLPPLFAQLTLTLKLNNSADKVARAKEKQKILGAKDNFLPPPPSNSKNQDLLQIIGLEEPETNF